MDNLSAFLSTIAVSELGQVLFKNSDRGYNVLVGGMLFEGYEDHPRISVYLPKLKIRSTAAGRYQILSKYYDFYKKQLGLKDFSPSSQDAIAIQMIKECTAYSDVNNGKFNIAIIKCNSRWASLPGAGYGQHENHIDYLRQVYVSFGGVTISENSA